MAHLDICLVYYVNKSRLACYDPLGSCFCCVAEMCGAQLSCLARCVNPFRQISIFVPLPAARWGWYSIRVGGWMDERGGGGRVQPGIKRSILIQCYWEDLSDVIKVPSLTLGASLGPSHNMNRPGIFKLANLPALEVIALVYQRSTQFITCSGTGRISVLISLRCGGRERPLRQKKQVEVNTATQRGEIPLLLTKVQIWSHTRWLIHYCFILDDLVVSNNPLKLYIMAALMDA